MILRSVAIISILVPGLCAMEDGNIETADTVVIKRTDYGNANLTESLKKNENISHLTIYTNYDYNQKGAYENYKNLARIGLQNKPKLTTLKIVGQFDMSVFFQMPRLSPTDQTEKVIAAFRQNPNMAWFINLQEFIIEAGSADPLPGSMADVDVFEQITRGALGLKKVKITGHGGHGLSFERL